MDINTLLNRMTPLEYHTKEQFIGLLDKYPELETSLELLLRTNTKWTKKAETGDVKFMINYCSWKVSKVHRKQPYVVLNVIHSTPVVSLNV